MYIPYPLLYLIIFALSLVVILFFIFGKKIGSLTANRFWEKNMNRIRKEVADSSRNIIKGQVSEQLAPYLPGFPFNPSECKFLGKPVDFVVFHKMEKADESAIVFVEVKTGQSNLNYHERNLKKAIAEKKVYWYEYRLEE